MKIPLLLLILSQASAFAQNPGEQWLRYKTPEQAGWSSELLTTICRNSNAGSVLLVHRGRIVYAYGEYWRRMKCHSLRKSFLGALYGISVNSGIIDTKETLGQLGITNNPPLTEDEKSARIIDLLRSRSGVYLPTGQETDDMAGSRPARGSHVHGVYWYYNNWDFNALGTIYRRVTGKEIFEAFTSEIADPLRLEDFGRIDGVYDYEPPDTSHPGYMFRMSARDAARFGQLYLQKGMWNGKQVVPERWIELSTAPYSITYTPGTSYGLLWWVVENLNGVTMYFAAGYGGQRICVFPSLDIVLVINSDTYSGNTVFDVDYVIPDLVFRARVTDGAEIPEFVLLEEPEASPAFPVSNEDLRRFVGTHAAGDTSVTVVQTDEGLALEGYHYDYRFRLEPRSRGIFHAEGIDLLLCFEMDSTGRPAGLEIHKSETTRDLYRLILKEGIESASKQFRAFGPRLRKKEELEFLCSQIAARGIPTLPLRKLNAASFPWSYRAQKDLNDHLLESGNLASARDVFRDLAGSLENPAGTKTRWFADILDALSAGRTLTTAEASALAGHYGYLHIQAEEGELYYRTGARMLLMHRMSGRKFAIEETYNMIIEFGQDDDGAVDRVIVRYYRDSFDEMYREKP